MRVLSEQIDAAVVTLGEAGTHGQRWRRILHRAYLTPLRVKNRLPQRSTWVTPRFGGRRAKPARHSLTNCGGAKKRLVE